MKKSLLSLIVVGILFFHNTTVQSQIPQTSAVLSKTLQCVGGTTNRAGIAHNPNQQLYYSVNAGSGTYPIETFDTAGTALATAASGYSYRGLWWNINTNQVEGKDFAGNIVTHNLDGSFYAIAGGTSIITGVVGPNSQACADYDWIDDEILYYDNGSFYRYTRAAHTLVASTAITGLPVAITNLNNNSIAYTGVVGQEIGVYDYVNQAFYFIDKTTGAYVSTCQLPASAPPRNSFGMGFENGYLWLFNGTTTQWEGYRAVLPPPCQLTGSVSSTICNEDTIIVNGTAYYAGNPSGTEVFTNVGPNNCDSTVTINLTVLAAKTGSLTSTICNEDTVIVNGTAYYSGNTSGTEVFTNVGPNNCDSTVTVNLTVLAALTGSVTTTICNNDNVVVNGTTYNAGNPSGTEVFTNVGPNNCDSTVTVNLTVLPAINLTITNASPVLTANQTGATYRWLDCDNGNAVIVGATSQSYTASVNGNYAVEITMGSCSDTSACENVSGVGINESNNFLGINIYPNPTNNLINVELGVISSTANFTLTSLDGKVVYQLNNVNDNKIAIDISNNSKGVYFLKIETNNQQQVYKVIKQ